MLDVAQYVKNSYKNGKIKPVTSVSRMVNKCKCGHYYKDHWLFKNGERPCIIDVEDPCLCLNFTSQGKRNVPR